MIADRPDAGSDSGSGGIGGTTVGGGGNGGAGATGGAGGTGGSSTDAGDWGAEPKWESVPGTAVGCSFEAMVNAAEVRMFKWEKCPWADGCEQAAFNPKVVGKDAAFNPTSNVQDDGNQVTVALAFTLLKNVAVFARVDGMGADAIRPAELASDCTMPVSTGSTFLANYYQIFDGGDVQARIGWSDGKLPLQPYLVPAQQSDGYGAVAYAHSHIGFHKGVAKVETFKYTSVELWAAKYDPDPSKLQPSLVATLPQNAIGVMAGGWGRLAMSLWSESKQASLVAP